MYKAAKNLDFIDAAKLRDEINTIKQEYYKRMNKISIIFVCTGNICRSPTAEVIFKSKIDQMGLTDFFS